MISIKKNYSFLLQKIEKKYNKIICKELELIPDMHCVFHLAIILASVRPGNQRDFSAQFPTPFNSTSLRSTSYSLCEKGPKTRVGSKEFTHFSLHLSSFLNRRSSDQNKIIVNFEKKNRHKVGVGIDAYINGNDNEIRM